mmetsp:Transcript_59966/g.111198  ORF Transcript_59966/g.111198 Transcript_59966/m.111198 type:complete len:278 (+) Transcript_59966:919-1752(+)
MSKYCTLSVLSLLASGSCMVSAGASLSGSTGATTVSTDAASSKSVGGAAASSRPRVARLGGTSCRLRPTLSKEDNVATLTGEAAFGLLYTGVPWLHKSLARFGGKLLAAGLDPWMFSNGTTAATAASTLACCALKVSNMFSCSRPSASNGKALTMPLPMIGTGFVIAACLRALSSMVGSSRLAISIGCVGGTVATTPSSKPVSDSLDGDDATSESECKRSNTPSRVVTLVALAGRVEGDGVSSRSSPPVSIWRWHGRLRAAGAGKLSVLRSAEAAKG